MNRLIHQLQLVAKMGNDFGNVHKALAANGFVAEIAVHSPTHGIRAIEDAHMSLQVALLVPNVNRA